MSSANVISMYMPHSSPNEAAIAHLAQALHEADYVLIGAGAGLSTSAGYTYSGERFEHYFADFHSAYGIEDMYTGGFYPFSSLEEYWAWWSRHIYINRYIAPPKHTYEHLLELLEGKDYFVLTTNADHCFQRAGFDKDRLFYTQGDYGLWQCSLPCHQQTYDNEVTVRRMVNEQRDMKIPTELIPHCPKCGRPMTMNLRIDATFVEDEGWHHAADRYEAFLERSAGQRVLYLELGVGMNTPGIIKFPFWRMTAMNPNATYACLNYGETGAPVDIIQRSICINGDIDATLTALQQCEANSRQ